MAIEGSSTDKEAFKGSLERFLTPSTARRVGAQRVAIPEHNNPRGKPTARLDAGGYAPADRSEGLRAEEAHFLAPYHISSEFNPIEEASSFPREKEPR